MRQGPQGRGQQVTSMREGEGRSVEGSIKTRQSGASRRKIKTQDQHKTEATQDRGEHQIKTREKSRQEEDQDKTEGSITTEEGSIKTKRNRPNPGLALMLLKAGLFGAKVSEVLAALLALCCSMPATFR